MNKKVTIGIGVIVILVLAFAAYKYFKVPTLTLYQYDVVKKTGKFKFGSQESNIINGQASSAKAMLGWSITPTLNSSNKLIFNLSQFGKPKKTLVPKGITV